MCCGTYCIKLLMLIIIIPFTIVSFVLLVVGGILIGGKDLIKSWLGNALVSVEKELGISLSGTIDQLFKVLSPAGWGLLWVGVICLAICVIGIIGICCKYKILVIIYAALVGAIFLAQLLLVIIYVARKDTFEKEGFKLFQETMIYKEYEGDKATNLASMIVNLAHVMLECCGAVNGSDFKKARAWKNKIEIKKYSADIEKYIKDPTITAANVDTDPKTAGLDVNVRNAIKNNGNIILEYPITCCSAPKGSFVPDKKCITAGPTTANSRIAIGCYPKLIKEVNTYVNTIALIVVGVLVVIPGLLFALAILLMYAMDKEVA